MIREQVELDPRDRLQHGKVDPAPVETGADQGPLGRLREMVAAFVNDVHIDTADQMLYSILRLIDSEIGAWQLEQRQADPLGMGEEFKARRIKLADDVLDLVDAYNESWA